MSHALFDPDRVDIIHYPDDPTPSGWHQPVLALGNFDGVHRGHAKILDQVGRRADERGATAAALTFDPHPSRVVYATPPGDLTDEAEQRRYFHYTKLRVTRKRVRS